MADIIFQEIRDYQNKLNTELEKRRFEFYSMADEYTAKVLPETDIVQHDNLEHSGELKVAETIDDLILAAIEAHNQNLLIRQKKLYKNNRAKPE
nr:hypothetical protein [Treponema sp. OMZ 790]